MTYVRTPFANSGDRDPIPEGTPGQDAVSFTTGYGPRYEEDPTSLGTARRIERREFNELMNLVTEEIQRYQQFDAPEFILAADNGGVSFPYSFGASVRYNPVTGGTTGADTRVYRSLVNTNTELPTVTTNWLDTSDYLTSANAVTSIATTLGITADVSVGGVTLGLDLNAPPTTGSITDAHFLPFSTGLANQKVTIGNFLSTFITKALIDPLQINADTLDGLQATAFVASSRAVNTAGQSGLSGGGDLSVDRSLFMDVDNLTPANAVGANRVAFSSAPGTTRSTTLDQAVGAVVTVGFVNALVGVDAESLQGRSGAFDQTANTVVLRDVSGGVTAASFTAIGEITAFASDARLKNINEDIDPQRALDFICSIDKVKYQFKPFVEEISGGAITSSQQNVGFIVQDFSGLYPELVENAPFDRDTDGVSISGQSYKTLKYDKIPVLNSAAIEALNTKVEALERRIKELEKL